MQRCSSLSGRIEDGSVAGLGSAVDVSSDKDALGEFIRPHPLRRTLKKRKADRSL